MLRLVNIQIDEQAYKYHMMKLSLKPDLINSNIIFTTFWLFIFIILLNFPKL